MDRDYADDALVTPLEMAREENEVKLIDYMQKIGERKLWIYTESARIENACGAAAELIKEKNREIALTKSKLRQITKLYAEKCMEVDALERKLKRKVNK